MLKCKTIIELYTHTRNAGRECIVKGRCFIYNALHNARNTDFLVTEDEKTRKIRALRAYIPDCDNNYHCDEEIIAGFGDDFRWQNGKLLRMSV